jgi:eukaryotic-like serine/threonine-protein kinase
VSLAVVYAAIWRVPLLRAWSHRALRGMDLVGSAAIGVAFAGITMVHPSPAISVWEATLAVTTVFGIRALLVPSGALWTAIVGVLSAAPPVAVIVAQPAYFANGLAPRTVVMLTANRMLTAIASAAVVSGVLYGLRRQVREARRLGQYTLEDRLGHGGMGVVYRARHSMLRRPTAIKLMRNTGSASPERFENEVQLMAGFNHPNMVAIHDYGRTADGRFYYAMEYLDGLDLEQLCEMDGPQAPARVIHFLRQICAALSEAHASDFIHRDIKPANVFVCRGRALPDLVKVLDFGLVKDLAGAESGPDLTVAGALVGTPLYIAPESITRASGPDARTDLYSLGAVAYRLLCGSPPFAGRTSVEVCAHHLHTPALPPSERTHRPIPADLEAVVMRCMQKAPEERFATAMDMTAALDRCADAQAWTLATAQAWWTDAGARLETWQAQRNQRHASDADSIVIDPRDRHARR